MQHQEPEPTADPVLVPVAALTLVLADAVAALLGPKPIEDQEPQDRLASLRILSSELVGGLELLQPGGEISRSHLPALFPDHST